MPILVKNDEVRSGRKAKARHGWLLAAQGQSQWVIIWGLLYTGFTAIEYWGDGHGQ